MRKIAVFFLIICSSLHAQIPQSYDSLKSYLSTHKKDTNYILALNDYTFLTVMKGDFNEAHTLIDQMDALSHQLNFGTGLYKAMNMRGVIEYSKQNSKKALTYFNQANDLITRYHLPKVIRQNSLNNIGIIYNQIGDKKNATKYAMELITFQEKNKIKPFKSWPYTQMGDNLKFYNKPNEAIIYYKKALEIEEKMKDWSGLAICENRLGNVYEDIGADKKAIHYFELGYFHAKKANYKLLEVDLMTNLGRMYRKDKRYEIAESFLRKAEKYNLELESVQSLKIVYSNLGQLYFSQKKYDLAQKYYTQALELTDEILDLESTYTAHEHLASLFEVKGDYKKAYQHKIAAELAKDSINKLEIQKNTEELLRKYEADKKEQKINVLSAMNKVKSLQIESSKKQTWYLLIGMLLLSIIGGLFYVQNRNRKRTNLQLQILNSDLDAANKAKTRFFSILNHDLRGPVANLVWFLQLQKNSPDLLDEESKQRIQDKTISGAENLLVSMEDMLQWSKSQMNNFKPQPNWLNVNQLFSDIRLHFESETSIDFYFDSPLDLRLFSDENYLKTIMRNLTGNAIKALENNDNPTIRWKAWQEESSTFLAISDNGKGITTEQLKAFYDENESVGIQTGLGLHLIRDLAKAIDCSISVHSEANTGTEFILELKKNNSLFKD